MLFLAAVLSGLTMFMMHRAIANAEGILGQPDVTEGSVKGFALGSMAVAFGSVGAFCIAKALIGFQNDFDGHPMLVKYHDELKTLLKNKDQTIDSDET